MSQTTKAQPAPDRHTAFSCCLRPNRVRSGAVLRHLAPTWTDVTLSPRTRTLPAPRERRAVRPPVEALSVDCSWTGDLTARRPRGGTNQFDTKSHRTDDRWHGPA